MFHRYGMFLILLATVLRLVVSAARADVFNMPSGEASLQFVTVGNPGNAAAPGTVDGSVPYVYQTGKYDVTVAQYCQFLNVVAATDTYGLYYSGMATDMPTVGIVQSGSAGGYTYSVSYNATAWQTYSTNYPSLYPTPSAAANDCPIFDVTWGDAARFCNWLQNGQPAGTEGAGTTEAGAYPLNGRVNGLPVRRNARATYFLPSADEWYKAAYYNPSNGTYWTYPTQSDTAPSNVLSATGRNNANYNDSSDSPHTGNGGYTDPTNYLTPVGAFALSPGPYGTFDMGGDVFQWNESSAVYGGQTEGGTDGGSWNAPSLDLEWTFGRSRRGHREPLQRIPCSKCRLGLARPRRCQ